MLEAEIRPSRRPWSVLQDCRLTASPHPQAGCGPLGMTPAASNLLPRSENPLPQLHAGRLGKTGQVRLPPKPAGFPGLSGHTPQWACRTPRPWCGLLAVPSVIAVTTGKPHPPRPPFSQGNNREILLGCGAWSQGGGPCAGVQCRGPSRQVTHINPSPGFACGNAAFPPRPPFPCDVLLGSYKGPVSQPDDGNWSLFAIQYLSPERYDKRLDQQCKSRGDWASLVAQW